MVEKALKGISKEPTAVEVAQAARASEEEE
jgi:hypothetical protein